jgi:ribosome-associated toxin RatA of RatAB toxin-antitoxin module
MKVIVGCGDATRDVAPAGQPLIGPREAESMADRTESSILVGAEPGDVLDVIADFEAYPEWTGAVRQAEVLELDELGWARTVRFVLDAGALRDTYTLAYVWEFEEDGQGSVSWGLVEATILKAMDGTYRLRRTEAGTEVTYNLAVDVRMPMLGMLRRRAEKTIIDTALNELKKRVEA